MCSVAIAVDSDAMAAGSIGLGSHSGIFREIEDTPLGHPAPLPHASGRNRRSAAGIAGAGKPECALELAYRYERDRFAHCVWTDFSE